MVESTGVFFAGRPPGQEITDDLKRGYRAEGLAQIWAACSTPSHTTFSQNVGLLSCGHPLKRPIYWAAGLLMAMELC